MSKTTASTRFDVLHSAHRARMAQVIATSAADRLRSVAQVVGLAHDTSRRIRELPSQVVQAMSTADHSLTEQINELERFTDDAGSGPVNMSVVAENTVALMHGHWGPLPQFIIEHEPHLQPAKANATDIAEVLFALLMNASEAVAGRKAATVIVQIEGTAQSINVAVEDDGPGVAPRVKRHLFDAFATTRAASGHLGIGLTVARELVQRNGGDLLNESRTGRGARFTFSVPRWTSDRVRSGRSSG
jgi:C4-dicarboxylate-specific signal transduction histidine kinase